MATYQEAVSRAVGALDVEELRKIVSSSTLHEMNPSALGNETCLEESTSPFHHLARTFKRANLSTVSGDSTEHTLSLSKDLTATTKDFRNPHWWLSHVSDDAKDSRRRCIAYILNNTGEDVNGRDHSGATPLYIAAIRGEADLCDALLQCGADPTVEVGGKSIMAHVTQLLKREEQRDYSKDYDGLTLRTEDAKIDISRIVFEIFRFYWPGIWSAVQMESVEKVRKLLNVWCCVNVSKNGQSLMDLALSTGNETIISLLINISPTMDVIHKCLAGDVPGVESALSNPSGPRINLNMKKLSEGGASILYFVVRSGNLALAKLLVEEGANPFALMLDEENKDIPVIFTALESSVNPEMVSVLLPRNPLNQLFLLDPVRHKGKSLLKAAIEKGVPDYVLLDIILAGGPTMLTEADELGRLPSILLDRESRSDLALETDKLILQWVTGAPVYPGWREILLLQRPSLLERLKDSDEAVKAFLERAGGCRETMKELFSAVEEGNFSEFMQACAPGSSFHLVDLAFLGRIEDNVMPLLHWVVLHERTAMLEFIVHKYLEAVSAGVELLATRLTLDDVRDPWRRTPLHYGYGMKNGGQLIKILSNGGATDHTLDKFDREPLDFKNAQSSEAMEKLLGSFKNKNFTVNQEEPWDPENLFRHQEAQKKQRFLDNSQKSHHYHQPNCRFDSHKRYDERNYFHNINSSKRFFEAKGCNRHSTNSCQEMKHEIRTNNSYSCSLM